MGKELKIDSFLKAYPVIKYLLQKYKYNKVLKQELENILWDLYKSDNVFKELLNLLNELYQAGYNLSSIKNLLPDTLSQFRNFWIKNSQFILKQLLHQLSSIGAPSK